MNAEGFQDTLINHCREEIQDLYYQCKHYGVFDASDFSERLDTIWAEAKINGVNELDFRRVVKSILQDHSDTIEYPFAVAA